MKCKATLITLSLAAAVAASCGIAISASPAPDKYTLKVPGGLAFSEFRGYETWEVISVSQHGDTMAAILGNPVIINAFKSGIPGNGKPFPDGSKMAKIHWNTKVNTAYPGAPRMPVSQPSANRLLSLDMKSASCSVIDPANINDSFNIPVSLGPFVDIQDYSAVSGLPVPSVTILKEHFHS